MHVAEYGWGGAVVLLHGMPSSTQCFEPLVRGLSRTHRVVVPDLPGYGQTPALNGAYTMPRVQALLEAELLSRGIERAIVAGYSGGAYRALALALSSRIRVDAVISIAGFAGLDADSGEAFRGLAQLLRRNGVEGFRASWLARMAGPGFAEKHPAEAGEVLSWLDSTSPPTLASELEAIAAADDLRPLLRSLRAPLMAVAGALDAAVPSAWSEAMVGAVPHGELRLVPGYGHAILYEDAEGTAEALRQFVVRVTG